jgi:OTU domain-containing protein 6
MGMQLRKASLFENMRKSARDEVAAENDRSVEDERAAILAGCTKLGVRIKEIDPDGHW